MKQRIRPQSNEKRLGLQEDQKRYDDLENLIVSASDPVNGLSARLDAHPNDDNSVYAFLPKDYFFLLNDRSLTKDLCGVTYAPTTANYKLDTACYTLPSITITQFATLEIWVARSASDIGSATYTKIFSANTYFPSGLPSLESKFELLNLIIQTLNKEGFDAKYETYRDVSCPGGIVVTKAEVDAAQPFLFQNRYNTGSPITQQITVTKKTYTKLSDVAGSSEKDNRLTKTAELFQLLGSSSATTFHYSPITCLSNRKLIGYHNKKFILSKFYIDYIRMPKKISLSLNQSCELSENVHEEIVFNTAKRLAGNTLSEAYKNLINESLLKE